MWEMLTHPSLKNLPDFIRKNQLNTFVLFARRKFIKFILFKVFFEFDKFSVAVFLCIGWYSANGFRLVLMRLRRKINGLFD